MWNDAQLATNAWRRKQTVHFPEKQTNKQTNKHSPRGQTAAPYGRCIIGQSTLRVHGANAPCHTVDDKAIVDDRGSGTLRLAVRSLEKKRKRVRQRGVVSLHTTNVRVMLSGANKGASTNHTFFSLTRHPMPSHEWPDLILCHDVRPENNNFSYVNTRAALLQRRKRGQRTLQRSIRNHDHDREGRGRRR